MSMKEKCKEKDKKKDEKQGDREGMKEKSYWLGMSFLPLRLDLLLKMRTSMDLKQKE